MRAESLPFARAPFSGDARLDARQARAYFAYAWRELRADREPHDVVQSHAAALEPGDARSPFRVYAETILRETVERYLTGPATIVDIGCGPGQYATWFESVGGRYHGVDIRADPRWAQAARSSGRLTIGFHRLPAEDLTSTHLPVTFSLSSSALEHVDDPHAVVEGLASLSAPGSHGLHIVPGPWSILAYGQHGWRRYSAAQLAGLFEGAGFDRVALYRLGGLPSLLLHIVWITGLETGWALQALTFSRLPFIFYHVARRIRLPRARTGRVTGAIYRCLLGAALKLDRYMPFTPVGYAIVVRRRPGEGVTGDDGV